MNPNKVRPLLGIILFAALWELLARSGSVPSYYLPPLTVVVSQFFDRSFLFQIVEISSITLARSVFSLACAILIAIPLGVALGRSRILYGFLSPILEFLRPLPSSAILPVALLFLGIGTKTIVAVAVFGSIWPILVATTQGSQNLNRVLADTVKLLKLPLKKRVIHLYLPSALPFIIAGVRTSLAISLILVVTGEMLVGSQGLGFFILDMERAFRIPEMYGGIFTVGIVGLSLNLLFERLAKGICFWQQEST